METKILIVDDEPIARKRILNLLTDFKSPLIIEECDSGTCAINKIESFKPGIVFLDIKLKDMTGFDVLNQVKVNLPLIVFTTAYDEFALKAFDFFAFDFLLKPYKDERFFKSLNKSLEYLTKSKSNSYQDKIEELLSFIQDKKEPSLFDKKDKLLVKVGSKATIINACDIMYILANAYHAEIYTKEKKYVLRTSLTKLMGQLDNKLFARIHRSTIVNVNFIQEIIFSGFGEIDTKMTDGSLFRVSKSNKELFIKNFKVE